MSDSIRDPRAALHSEERMSRPRMAKADLRKAEADAESRRIFGRVILRLRQLSGLSLKEFAALVDRDPRQCARWEDGTERPQFDAIFAALTLRQPLVIAIAELAGVEVETNIRIRRTA